MKFILNMAWREMRASWQRLLFFFLSIAIGVGSIVSLRSFTQIMKASIGCEARSLSGGDVRVGVNQPWKAETRAMLEGYSDSPLVVAHTEIISTQTMTRLAVEDFKLSNEAIGRGSCKSLSQPEAQNPLARLQYLARTFLGCEVLRVQPGS